MLDIYNIYLFIYSNFLFVTIVFQIFDNVKQVNVSHIIHDLSFGPMYPGIHNPLDGNVRILHDESGSFKYFLKVRGFV